MEPFEGDLNGIEFPDISMIKKTDKQEPEDSVEFSFRKIALASFSRSGNTMLRAYIEKITGLATGSDGNVSSKMVQDLV